MRLREMATQGWVAESYFEMHRRERSRREREYDAAQLTVVEDEVLDVLDRQGVWVLCRNAAGIQGWVPSRILEDAAPRRLLTGAAMTT